jgi:hypothetical protein
MASRDSFHKVIIGRSEALTFVESAAINIPAKTDTGAYRSAVHATKIREKDGILHFDLFGGHPVCGGLSIPMKTRQFEQVMVENSFGHQETRYEVKLKVKLGPKVFFARFTLANRAKKIYPILLGRKLLNGRFLVDPSRSTIDRRDLREKFGVEFPRDEEGTYDS